MNKVLVVVVDTQFDFMMPQGRLPVPGADALIAPGIDFLAGLDPEEVAGVLFTFDTHDAENYLGSAEHLGDEASGIPGFPLHCEIGTPGWANVFNPMLVPDAIPTWELRKNVFDMWEQPSHEVHVQQTASRGDEHVAISLPREFFFRGEPGNAGDGPEPRGPHLRDVDTVRVIGVASDFCVAWAINGFLQRGFKVEVVGDLTAGIGKDIERTVMERFEGKVLVI